MSELPAKPRIKWYRTPIAADDLARLNQRSDWRGWLQTIGFLALLGVSGGIAWYAVGKVTLAHRSGAYLSARRALCLPGQRLP